MYVTDVYLYTVNACDIAPLVKDAAVYDQIRLDDGYHVSARAR